MCCLRQLKDRFSYYFNFYVYFFYLYAFSITTFLNDAFITVAYKQHMNLVRLFHLIGVIESFIIEIF